MRDLHFTQDLKGVDASDAEVLSSCAGSKVVDGDDGFSLLHVDMNLMTGSNLTFY